jgi:PTS system ascorbate-specific IIA component
MLRLLIIAHAPLASALKAVAAHIDAEAALAIEACDVTAMQSQDDVVTDGLAALSRLGDGEVLIFTDVFGATPCNAARRIGERPGVRVVAGVNVPALWRAIGHRNEPIDRVAELSVSGGQQGLMHVSVTRPQYQANKQNNDDSQHDHHQQ